MKRPVKRFRPGERAAARGMPTPGTAQRVGVAFGRPAPLGKMVFGLMIAGAAAGVGADGRAAVGAGRGAGFAVLGLRAGAGADSRVGIDGFGADRVGAGAVLAAAGAAVGDPRISSGGRYTTGEALPRITSTIVGSGVGCGMWVGLGSEAAAFWRPQAAVSPASRSTAAP
jgi:hypothetical protein